MPRNRIPNDPIVVPFKRIESNLFNTIENVGKAIVMLPKVKEIVKRKKLGVYHESSFRNTEKFSSFLERGFVRTLQYNDVDVDQEPLTFEELANRLRDAATDLDRISEIVEEAPESIAGAILTMEHVIHKELSKACD